MKVTLNLTGEMAELYQPKVVVEAQTLREVLSALKLIPCFDPSKTDKRFLCQIQGVDYSNQLDQPLETTEFTLDCQETLSPRDIQGSGNNPVVRIVVGVVLIVVGVVYDWSGSTAQIGAGMVAAGVGMVVGGIMELLNPMKLDSHDEEKNRSFTSYPNTVKSGTPIPLILGRHKWGGHIFSMNTQTMPSKDADLLNVIGELPEFNGSWVTFTSPMIGTTSQDERPPGGGGGYPGGGGGTEIPSASDLDIQ